MAEKEALIRQLDDVPLTWQQVIDAETPTQVIARQLSYLELQIIRVQERFDRISAEVQRLPEPPHDERVRRWTRFLPWHARFDVPAYVSLIATLMLIAFALLIAWA